MTIAATFVTAGNLFQFSFTGTPLARYEIQATAQFPPNWQTVTNLEAASDGSVLFLESIPPGAFSRFYRVVSH